MAEHFPDATKKADCISREAAIERFCNVYCGCSPEECGFKIQQDGAEECAAVRALKETPAADVVEVVRCKDCYAYRRDPELAKAAYLDPEQYCALLRCEFPSDGFCFYGRRDDNG